MDSVSLNFHPCGKKGDKTLANKVQRIIPKKRKVTELKNGIIDKNAISGCLYYKVPY